MKFTFAATVFIPARELIADHAGCVLSVILAKTLVQEGIAQLMFWGSIGAIPAAITLFSAGLRAGQLWKKFLYLAVSGLLISAACLYFGYFATHLAGPAFPEKNGRLYLQERGFDEATIQKVVQIKPLEESVLRTLARAPDTNVRFLVARNPEIPLDLMESLATDKDDFVRSGVSLNPRITSGIYERLLHDRSHTVYHKLALNPSLSEEMLWRLRRERNLDLMWFARNRALPDSIRKAIEQSGDDRAKNALQYGDRYIRQKP
jgi:hypothetical protein